MSLPPKKKKKKRRPGAPGHNRDFDIVDADSSFWVKVGGGAVAAPLLIAAAIWRMGRRGGGGVQLENMSASTLVLVLAGGVVVGALLGAAFGMRDIVQRAEERGGRAPLPLRLLFGKGIISVLIWIPVIIVVTFFVAMWSIL